MEVRRHLWPSHYALSLTLGLVLAAISVLALGGMSASGWLAQTARDDARTINEAGSLRMQTWRLMALASDAEPVQWSVLLSSIDRTWQHLETSALPENEQARTTLHELHRQWQHTLRPALATPEQTTHEDRQHVAEHVAALDRFTGQLQGMAETRMAWLGRLQMTLMLLTLPLVSYGAWRLFFHVRRPLRRLLGMVEALRSGQLDARTGYWRNDEIGLLAATIDDMAAQLDGLYRHMADQVEDRSHRLQESHLALTLLYDNARYLATTAPEEIDFEQALAPFSTLLAPASLQLLAPDAPSFETQDIQGHEFLLHDGDSVQGRLIARQPGSAPLPDWKRQICETVADHLCASLTLRAQGVQKRRLALMDERAVIARELHDSLAQSLSYLNIQAMRLSRQLPADTDSDAAATLTAMREGIDHAYRQLRELLVTFRLRLTEKGLHSAVMATINEFAARGGLETRRSMTLADDLLAPDEELHLVQILREALANVVQHARARQVSVVLQHAHAQVILTIEDDGIGLPEHLQKPGHHGTIIMQERARTLNGTLALERGVRGGTRVHLQFVPKGDRA